MFLKDVSYTHRCIYYSKISNIVKYTILPKVLGHPLLMKGLTTLVISMSINLNV